MAVGVIIPGQKENYICIVPLQFGSNIGSLQYSKNKKKNLFLVTIAAIFHKRSGLATISLKVDHICIISIKIGGNWLFTRY
jgi:hypothetical protein